MPFTALISVPDREPEPELLPIANTLNLVVVNGTAVVNTPDSIVVQATSPLIA